MILIAIGSNLPVDGVGPPLAVCEAALDALDSAGLTVLWRSRWYRTAPVPISDQPDFVNGVAAVETDLDPEALLACLHAIEARFGRERSVAGAARTLDLDLLDADGAVRDGGTDGKGLVLPHPRVGKRAFVLLPLRDVAPGWRHPVSGEGLEALIAALPPDQRCVPIELDNRG